MITILQLVAILALGYLSAHYLIGRLQTRFFFTSGIEYILLGVLVGPHVTDLMTPTVVSQLSPVVSLSIGSLGLLYGLRLRFTDFGKGSGEALRLTFLDALVTFFFVAGGFAMLLLFILPSEDTTGALPAILALGATAILSAPSAIQAVQRRYPVTGALPDLLLRLTTFSQVLGITAFGLIFCFFHEGATVGIRSLTITEWIAVNLGFGIILGGLFYLFLGGENSRAKLFVALIGLVVFSSGAAFYLNLSPLFINLVLGFILANTSGTHDALIEILESIEKPIYVVVLVVAGAAWNVAAAGAMWYLFIGYAVLYLVLRYAGKLVGGYAGHRTSHSPASSSRRIGAGMIAQGAVAVAMVVNYTQVYDTAYTDIVVTCVLVSVMVNEFISPSLTKDLLVDARQIVTAGA